MKKSIFGLFLFILVLFSPVQSFCQQASSNDDCIACCDDINIKECNASVHSTNIGRMAALNPDRPRDERVIRKK